MLKSSLLKVTEVFFRIKNNAPTSYFRLSSLFIRNTKKSVTHTGIHIGVNPLAWLLHSLEVHLLTLAHLVAVLVQRGRQTVSHLHLVITKKIKNYKLYLLYLLFSFKLYEIVGNCDVNSKWQVHTQFRTVGLKRKDSKAVQDKYFKSEKNLATLK